MSGWIVGSSISADLEELGKTDVCVVCAGAKSILDLEKTLEYLETKGVLVIGYQTEELPAFFTRESGIKVPIKLDAPEEIADIIKNKIELNINEGLLVANPIDEKFSLNKKEIDKTISDAILEMNKLNIQGKAVTPYLLSKINELSKGVSLNANKELVYNNCKLAAQIAVALKRLWGK